MRMPVDVHHHETPSPRSVHPALTATVEALMMEERTKWAMHIHDSLTQSVTSAVLQLQVLSHRIETDPEGAVAELREVEDALRGDLMAIRELLFELQEGRIPDDLSFAAFIDRVVERWRLPARVTIEGNLDDVAPDVIETGQAVVSEALANAAKHSGAKDVAVRVKAGDDEFRIEVEDRGRGIAAVTDDDPHFGLILLKSRAEQLGGTVEIVSTPGSGVRVIASLPLKGQGAGR
jgi:signal transduction histidine kinase